MSAVYAVLILAAYVAFAVIVTRAWCRWAARRIAEQQARDGQPQRIEDIETRAAVPAAPDNAEGTRLDWHDECERLWSAPYDPQTSSRKEGT